MRVLSLLTLACGVSFGSSFGLAPAAFAAPAERTSTPVAASQPATNACGCYQDEAGACHCNKKNQCGCPGECEPAGCEEKRQKQFEKEAQAELKKQQEEDKKRNAELAKKQEELERKDAEKRERGLRGLRLIEKK